MYLKAQKTTSTEGTHILVLRSQYEEDARNTVLWDPCAYVVFLGADTMESGLNNIESSWRT